MARYISSPIVPPESSCMETG